jgi:hypothetical protein
MTTTFFEQSLAQRHRFIFDREKINLESHQLVWLGQPIVSNNTLRNIIYYTKVFVDVKDCRQHIEQTKEFRTFLVCFLEHIDYIISYVHNLENVSKIYIYDEQKADLDKLSTLATYSKVSYSPKEIIHFLDHLKVRERSFR